LGGRAYRVRDKPGHGSSGKKIVDQDVVEVLVGYRGAVYGDHEHLLAELRDVLEDPAQIGRSHARDVSRAQQGPQAAPVR
jgi:hypothetical protein